MSLRVRSGFPRKLLALCALLGTTVGTANAALIGVDFGTDLSASVLYEIDPSTGAATNPRITGITGMVGISLRGDGTLFGLATNITPPLYLH